jgi:hypothetical protein
MAERESSLEERERKDKEKADEIQARRERLGHVEKTKSTSRSKKKTEEPKAAETSEE